MYTTPYLDKIQSTKDLKKLLIPELDDLASEIRRTIVAEKSNFLGSSLGVVELSIALNYVFSEPEDKVLWDIGHQKQPYNILLEKIGIIDQDPVSSTKPACVLSKAVGHAVCRDMNDRNYDIVSIVGDMSLSSGQAFEAMNHAGSIAAKMLVILNDNVESADNYGGAFGYYLKQLHSKHFKDQPCLFEDLGFNYIGPVDGHNIEKLIQIFTEIKNSKEQTPFFLHMKTKKGRGHAPTEADADSSNNILNFDCANNNVQNKKVEKTPPFFACKALIEAAHLDPKIMVVSLSMSNYNSPFLAFKDLFPERYIDVGVSEGHAISLACTLATQGFKPYVILYSNMLQRVLDQALVDACVQSYPVRFIIDHSSILLHSSQHAGFFDSTFLGSLSNLVLMSPGSQEDIESMIQFSAKNLTSPCVLRLSKELSLSLGARKPVELGIGNIIKRGGKVALLSYGNVLQDCIEAAELLDANGISTTVADARFLQPLDERMLVNLADEHDLIVSVEENASGGLSSHVLRVLNTFGLLNNKFQYHPIYIKELDDLKNDHNVITPEKIFNTIHNLLTIEDDNDTFYSVV